MKTRLFALLLSAALLVSCGGKAGGGSASQAGVPEGPASAGQEQEPSQEIVPSYFGQWVVTSWAGSTPDCAMTQAEINDCIRLAVECEAGCFTAEGETCEFLPGTAYVEGILTAEEFQTACGLSLEELEVDAAMLLHVTVDIQGEAGQARLLGRDFFVIGERLLIYCDGAFFWAERPGRG